MTKREVKKAQWREFYAQLRQQRKEMLAQQKESETRNEHIAKIAERIKAVAQYGDNNCTWLACQIAQQYTTHKNSNEVDEGKWLNSLKLRFATAYQIKSAGMNILKDDPFYILAPHKIYHFTYYAVYDESCTDAEEQEMTQ